MLHPTFNAAHRTPVVDPPYYDISLPKSAISPVVLTPLFQHSHLLHRACSWSPIGTPTNTLALAQSGPSQPYYFLNAASQDWELGSLGEVCFPQHHQSKTFDDEKRGSDIRYTHGSEAHSLEYSVNSSNYNVAGSPHHISGSVDCPRCRPLSPPPVGSLKGSRQIDSAIDIAGINTVPCDQQGQHFDVHWEPRKQIQKQTFDNQGPPSVYQCSIDGEDRAFERSQSQKNHSPLKSARLNNDTRINNVSEETDSIKSTADDVSSTDETMTGEESAGFESLISGIATNTSRRVRSKHTTTIPAASSYSLPGFLSSSSNHVRRGITAVRSVTWPALGLAHISTNKTVTVQPSGAEDQESCEREEKEHRPETPLYWETAIITGYDKVRHDALCHAPIQVVDSYHDISMQADRQFSHRAYAAPSLPEHDITPILETVHSSILVSIKPSPLRPRSRPLEGYSLFPMTKDKSTGPSLPRIYRSFSSMRRRHDRLSDEQFNRAYKEEGLYQGTSAQGITGWWQKKQTRSSKVADGGRQHDIKRVENVSTSRFGNLLRGILLCGMPSLEQETLAVDYMTRPAVSGLNGMNNVAIQPGTVRHITVPTTERHLARMARKLGLWKPSVRECQPSGDHQEPQAAPVHHMPVAVRAGVGRRWAVE